MTMRASNPKDLEAIVQINGRQVFKFGPTTSAITRVFSQAMHPTVLKKNTNTIFFKITGGTGGIAISNVVVWYRVNV